MTSTSHTTVVRLIPTPLPEQYDPASLRLAEALDTGPFHVALQAAIRTCGLSLESLQRKLRAHGHQVSLASLSYWQRGRSRPERTSSLAAVRTLEQILALPPDSLIGLLGPVRPRRRGADGLAAATSLTALGYDDLSLLLVSARMDPEANQRLESLTHEKEMHVDADGTGYRLRTRRVVRARTDGADRMVVLMLLDHPDAPPPTVTAGLNCRLGRVVHDDVEGLTAAELIFHRPLRAGETYLAEFEVGVSGLAQRVTRLDAAFRQPTANCLIQVRFDPRVLPIRCYPLWQPLTGQPGRLDDEVRVEPNGSTHLALADLPAGRYGLVWEWD